MENMIELHASKRLLSKPCPHCGQPGRSVELQTVKAMLAVSLELVRAAHYNFCSTATCPVVYFADEGEQCFGEADIRERVYQKHPDDDDVMICYCFRHTLRSIRDEWQQTGKSSVLPAITAGTQSGYCACDLRNPQGTCCLGNVRKFVQQLEQAQD